MMADLDHGHFRLLRDKINARLLEVGSMQGAVQERIHPWLHGALGAVPAEVMLVFLSPNLVGIGRTDVPTIDDGPPDLESQWWDGPDGPAATRLRPALCDVGLKTGGPGERGGWNCYLTYAIKEAAITADQEGAESPARASQARMWSDILAWEIEQVSPGLVLCIGRQAYEAVRLLQREGRLPDFSAERLPGYDVRGADETVRERLVAELSAAIEPVAEAQA